MSISSTRGARATNAPSSSTTGPAIKTQNGLRTLFLDGQPTTPLLVALDAKTSPTQISEFASAGVLLFQVGDLDLGWTAQGKSDFGGLDTRLQTILQAAPKALLLLRISMDAPEWWRRTHPEECTQGETNADAAGKSVAAYASWASRNWRNETGDALARLLRRLRESDAYSRIFALEFTAGTAGQWRHDYPEAQVDGSEAMTRHFRQFCVDKYRRNEGLLRQAWDAPRATFPRIACPSERDWKRGDYGLLRNPARSRDLLDYGEAYFQALNEAALHFCELARRVTEGRLLLGLPSPCVFGDTEKRALPSAAFFDTLLDSSAIDFFVSAPPASGGLFLNTLPGSLELREKFLFHRAPTTAVPAHAALAQTVHAGLILPPETPAATINALQAQYARAFRAPAAQNKRLRQVAVVVDPASALYTSATADRIHNMLLAEQMREIALLGAPVDVYQLSDLLDRRFPTYKVTIFLNILYLSEAEHRQMDARIKRSEQTAIWFWAPGVIGEEGITAELGQRTCGQKLRVEKADTSLRTRIADANQPLTWGWHAGASFGAEDAVSPTITVSDKTIVRLGANTANKTVASMRSFETWTSVVYGTTPVPARLLRNALQAAGCHLYVFDRERNATVFADTRHLAVATETPTAMKISLPGPHDILDPVNGTRLEANVSEFITPLTTFAEYEIRPLGKPAAKAGEPEIVPPTPREARPRAAAKRGPRGRKGN